MTRQAVLFQSDQSLPTIDPDRGEPAVWFERLTIWSAPDTLLRDVSFKRGLNIIWTPDAAELESTPDLALGHGAGKTMLCRLLRYCACDPDFYGGELHRRIKEKLPHAFVGAELVVGGQRWAVLRPIGDSKAEYLATDAKLEDLWAAQPSSKGIAPLAQAIEDAALPELDARAIPGRDQEISWAHALAWLTRDQECRFHGVLTWRGTSLEAKSPVLHNYSHEAKAHIARALLGMITDDEARLRAEHTELTRDRQRDEAALKNLVVSERDQVERLDADFDLELGAMPAGDLVIDYLQQIAQRRAAAAADHAPLEELRATRGAIARERAHVEAQARAAASKHAASMARHDALSERSAELDRHISELSELPDALTPHASDPGAIHAEVSSRVGAARERRGAVDAHIEHARSSASDAHDELSTLSARLDALAEEARDLDRQLEIELSAQRDAHYRAQRLLDEVERLDEISQKSQQLKRDIAAAKADLEDSNTAMQARRDRHRSRLARFELLFDHAIKRLVGEDAAGRVKVHSKSIDVALELDGQRVSAALESLKVVAFDLAALMATLEGTAALPGFLLHDSPREADLGRSLYDRLFYFVDELAQLTPEPAFQYIITTTTAPPQDLRDHVVLELRGAPTKERLLRTSL